MPLAMIPGSGGGRCGFVALTLRSFSFLLRLGFVVARKENTFVRYESERVFLNVYHGRSSFQVGLELGRIESGDTYSLQELLSALAAEDVELARYQTTEAEVLERCLANIAETVERRFGLLLEGDTAAFEALKSDVAPRRRAVTLQAQFGAIIDRADHAWEKRDWEVALDLYRQAQAALDETRVRRLEYLQARSSKPG